jgi:phosphoribosylformylglycinamidine synthase subunit PurL
LIHSGVVKSAHDCSEGGLAVTLAESCISQQSARETPRLIGAQVDLSSSAATKRADGSGVRLDALLFGEAQGRVVITTSALDAVKAVERAKLLGISATRLGTVGGAQLTICLEKREYSWAVSELHDCWWNSIARAMR